MHTAIENEKKKNSIRCDIDKWNACHNQNDEDDSILGGKITSKHLLPIYGI